VYLHGDLGAGKTTVTRALLRTLGVGERIKSPTYSLIESYRVGDRDAHHLDLYRIADAGELEWLGLDEIADGKSLILVEWPERGGSALPRPDLVLEFGDRVGVFANRADFPAMRKFFGDSIKGTAEFSYISIGLGMALGLLLGAVSATVAEHAKCSVLIAHGTAVPPELAPVPEPAQPAEPPLSEGDHGRT